MQAAEFLDFDDAVKFLRTTPSTLYKWLQNGKVPAHKLGRQWRFSRDALERHVAGDAAPSPRNDEVAQILARLGEDGNARAGLADLAKALLWRGFEKCGQPGFHGLILQPAGDNYAIIYRTATGDEFFSPLSAALFHALDDDIRKSHQPGREENSRRIYLSRGDDTLQARYQRIDTVAGPVVTCQIFAPMRGQHATLADIEKLAPHNKVLETTTRWLAKPQGIIVVTGLFGSGKTTTVYALLAEAAKQGRRVFTLEDSAAHPLERVNHVELAARNADAFTRQLAQIYASEADVIGIVVDPFPGLDQILYTEAAHAAGRNRIIILQTTSSSPAAAQKAVRQAIPADYDGLFTGIISQKLMPAKKGFVAEYVFLEG